MILNATDMIVVGVGIVRRCRETFTREPEMEDQDWEICRQTPALAWREHCIAN